MTAETHSEGSASVDNERIKPILEAALLAAGRPLAMNDLEQLFAGDLDAPPRTAIRAALAELGDDWQGRCLALQEVASGFRAQVRDEFEPWLSRLWDEKPARYSRALLETLAIIAYRQPITRSEIEEIRGVSVSTQIMRTLGEREWVRVVGHRDAPGRPAMYGTTRAFLDHFNLKTLDQLPDLSELNELGGHPELEFDGGTSTSASGEEAKAADEGIAAVVPTGAAEEGDAPAAADRDDADDGSGANANDESATTESAANEYAGEEHAADAFPADGRPAEDYAEAVDRDAEDPPCTSVS